MPSRQSLLYQATAATVLALIPLNLALAYGIARGFGSTAVDLPPAVAAGAAIIGFVCLAGAVALWRRYLAASRSELQSRRPSSSGDTPRSGLD